MALETALETQDNSPKGALDVARACAREVYVLSAGTVKGALKEGCQEAQGDPKGTAERLGGSLALGAVLGYMQRGDGLGKFAVEALAAGSALSLAADVPARWSELCHTASDTWSHPENTEQNLQAVQRTMGRFGFDTATTTLAAMTGSMLTGYAGINKSHLPEFTRDGFLPPGEHSATWSEFKDRYGTTPWRKRLLGTFETTLGEIKDAGGTKVYVGGSYVTAKARPTDIDGIWSSKETGQDWAPLSAKIADLDPRRYTDLYADNEWMGGKRQGKDFIRFNEDTGKRVGIVALDLNTLPR